MHDEIPRRFQHASRRPADSSTRLFLTHIAAAACRLTIAARKIRTCLHYQIGPEQVESRCLGQSRIQWTRTLTNLLMR